MHRDVLYTNHSFLAREPVTRPVGELAVFAASDWGRTITAATINVSCGAPID